MFFLISNIIVVIILIFLLYVLSAVWPPDSPLAPGWQMPEHVCIASAILAKVGKKDIVYDLGCGTGKALIIADKKFGAKGVGIEIDPIRSLLAKFNVWKARSNVKIIKNNFYNINLSSATVIYMYLVPRAMGRLTQKLLKELKPGTRIARHIQRKNKIISSR